MPRKATWLVIGWTVLMAVWAITVPGSAGQACTDVAAASRSACELAATLGSAATLVVVFIVWLIGFLVTLMVWRMTRHRNHTDGVSSSM